MSEPNNEEDPFCLTVTSRNDEPKMRVIRRSMINRSCINTINYSGRSITEIPEEIQITSARLAGIQKIDISFNDISSINELKFDQFNSLKELILNDNQIVELPHHSLNSCRQLRLINVCNNRIVLLPPLTVVSFILAKNNPFRLVTAQLHSL